MRSLDMIGFMESLICRAPPRGVLETERRNGLLGGSTQQWAGSLNEAHRFHT